LEKEVALALQHGEAPLVSLLRLKPVALVAAPFRTQHSVSRPFKAEARGMKDGRYVRKRKLTDVPEIMTVIGEE
jgi:hypothetical protein